MVPVSVAIGGMSGCVLPGRIIGVQEFRSSGVQEFRSSGVQEFRSSGVQGGTDDEIARMKLL
jgi:hypothetical protein